MDALPGGEVQGTLSAVPTFCRPLRPQPQQACRQNLAHLAQTLIGGHAVGIERVVHQRGFSWREADIRMLYIGLYS